MSFQLPGMPFHALLNKCVAFVFLQSSACPPGEEWKIVLLFWWSFCLPEVSPAIISIPASLSNTRYILSESGYLFILCKSSLSEAVCEFLPHYVFCLCFYKILLSSSLIKTDAQQFWLFYLCTLLLHILFWLQIRSLPSSYFSHICRWFLGSFLC